MKKLIGLFVAISVFWVSLPVWSGFSSGNGVYYDLGSQSFHLIFIWGAFAVIRGILKRKSKKQIEEKKLA